MSGKRTNSVVAQGYSHADSELGRLRTANPKPMPIEASADPLKKLDAHVVLLINYVRPHHVAAFTELAKRVRDLTVLLSVPMEPDRNWQPQWDDLDVRVQKNWMFTARWKHSSGFAEPNFIHFPIDTTRQLKKLNADIVFSYEMGMRTVLSCWYRRFHPKVPLVMVGNMSEHIEAERGLARRMLRRSICRHADYFTYNGPSCERYLESLSLDSDRLFEIPYCIDSSVVFEGPREASDSQHRKLLYCGALSERKGILQFTQVMRQWCDRNPQRQVTLSIAGDGPLKDSIADQAAGNFKIAFQGNCDSSDLRNAYRENDIAVFPSLADEWGLVPIEAMKSGLPVLGSFFAQSVEAHCEEGKNGWVFDPTNQHDLKSAIDRAMTCSNEQLLEMGLHARQSVAHVSPQRSADLFCQVIKTALPHLRS
ncbi:glycosyltransferase family 4 protein [Mariniblastus sp.]|nr:glycosyltransferase family 4 protein [Mariniblastus sp.]